MTKREQVLEATARYHAEWSRLPSLSRQGGFVAALEKKRGRTIRKTLARRPQFYAALPPTVLADWLPQERRSPLSRDDRLVIVPAIAEEYGRLFNRNAPLPFETFLRRALRKKKFVRDLK